MLNVSELQLIIIVGKNIGAHLKDSFLQLSQLISRVYINALNPLLLNIINSYFITGNEHFLMVVTVTAHHAVYII